MKIIVTGATGLIGKKITRKLLERGDEVIVFSRSIDSARKIIPKANKYVVWPSDTNKWNCELDGIDAVIHLAGENVMGRRWNEKHKIKVLESRVNGTKSLIEAIAQADKKPHTFICASAVGYYGNSELPVDEDSLPAKDYLANVVKEWEAAAAEAEKYSVRRVSVRIGIVLDKKEGALVPLLKAFKFFVGGPIGSGRQWFPWIHADDVADIFIFALDNKNVIGPINACAPNPVTMNQFAKTLGTILNRPSFFRVPSFILRIVIGEGAESILSGANVESEKIRKLGYRFMFNNLEDALKSILKK